MTDVADAARRTLRAGTVRVWLHQWWSADGPDASSIRIGVADLARKRTAMRSEGELTGVWADVEERLRASNARIVTESDDDDGPHRTFHVGEVLINMNMHGQFFVVEEGDPSPRAARSAGDPLWIVEQLATRDAETTGARFRFQDGVRYDGTWTVDAFGRLTEVTWTLTHRGRPRAPFSRGPHHRVWSTLRLDDYGLAVDVDVPEAFPASARPLRPRDVWDLWQLLRPRRR